MSRIKIISKRQVFKSRYFSVNEADVTYADKKDKYYYVEKNPGVYIIALTSGQEVLMVKQYKYVYGRDFIQIVAGALEKGELPLEGAKRELKEETGYTASAWYDLGIIHSASNFTKETKYFYFAAGLAAGKMDLEPDEEITLMKIPLANALSMIINGEIDDEKSIAGILLVSALLQKGKLPKWQ